MNVENMAAFPVLDRAAGGLSMRHEGMSLRDYFAARAMQGDWAAQSEVTGTLPENTPNQYLAERAAFYYRMADAMLEARQKKS